MTRVDIGMLVKSNTYALSLNPMLKHKLNHREENRTDDIELPCNATIPPAIPDGEHYEVAFVHAERAYIFKSEKIYLWFKIITPGDWIGQELYMACSVARLGKWGPSHKFYLAWVFAADRKPNRVDRMSTKVFRNKVFRARIRTVGKTASQKTRTIAQRYSVRD